MGWRDRDYNRKEPNEPDDDFVDPSYDEASRDEDYLSDEDDQNDVDPDAPDDRDIPPDEPALVSCPNCRKMILEEAEQCHHCGHFVMDDERAGGWPVWMWVALALALIVAVMWGLFG